MKTLKITKTRLPHILEVDTELGMTIEVWHYNPEEKIATEIADQIHDAFAVANETGLTPRQLLERNNELLHGCQTALQLLAELNMTSGDVIDKIEQSIKKATQ